MSDRDDVGFTVSDLKYSAIGGLALETSKTPLQKSTGLQRVGGACVLKRGRGGGGRIDLSRTLRSQQKMSFTLSFFFSLRWFDIQRVLQKGREEVFEKPVDRKSRLWKVLLW